VLAFECPMNHHHRFFEQNTSQNATTTRE